MGVIIMKIFHTCLGGYCTENRSVWAESLQNFAKFLPLPNVAHLPAWGALKFDKRVRAKPKISTIAHL